MCIDYYHVFFSQNHVSVRNHSAVPASDENDDRMSGEIQITDAMAVPRIIFLQDNFLQSDMFFIVKGFCSEYHYIVCFHLHNTYRSAQPRS